MAEQRITLYHSDLSGVEIGPDTAGLQFSFDGIDYEIDLTEDEQARLRAALAPYLAVAREVVSNHTNVPSARRAAGEPAPRELRAWAQENGFGLSARGRIPQAVIEAYKAAHQSAPPVQRQPPWRTRALNRLADRPNDANCTS